MKVALTVFCMSLGMLAVLDAIFSWRIVRRSGSASSPTTAMAVSSSVSDRAWSA